MSSYWAGYYGAALVLNDDEFESFLQAYAKRIYNNANDARTQLDNELTNSSINEYAWIKSNSDTTKDVSYFYITNINKDENSGMFFIPFMVQQETTKQFVPNLPKYTQKQYVESKILNCENCYVIFSNKNLDGPDCFIEKPYESYDTFVQEFKDKLENYLPTDFDWNTHLGNFSYAAFG